MTFINQARYACKDVRLAYQQVIMTRMFVRHCLEMKRRSQFEVAERCMTQGRIYVSMHKIVCDVASSFVAAWMMMYVVDGIFCHLSCSASLQNSRARCCSSWRRGAACMRRPWMHCGLRVAWWHGWRASVGSAVPNLVPQEPLWRHQRTL